MQKNVSARINKQALPYSWEGPVFIYRSFDGSVFFHLRIIHFRHIDTVKLTTAPNAASAMVFSISPELMFTNRMVTIPPAVPAFEAGVINESFILLL